LELFKDDVLYLQNNLRIVDPVYGILKPLDRMQAYRLEMATRNVLSSSGKKSEKSDAPIKLHEFWKDSVTKQLTQELQARPADQQILLNLASDEYAAAVAPSALQEGATDAQYVKVVFREQGRVIAIHAKRARGLMVRFLAETKAATLEDVKKFDKEGYKLVAKDCDETTLVFDRSKQPPPSSAKGSKRAAAPSDKATEAKTRGKKGKS